MQAGCPVFPGREVNIKLSGDPVYGGTIAGRDAVRITADNIDNISGRIHADKAFQRQTHCGPLCAF